MDADQSRTEAMDDTHARLLALEMVTSAVLNQIAREDPRVMSVLEQLSAPTKLPDTEAAGGAEGLARLQANVSRLASAITARL